MGADERAWANPRPVLANAARFGVAPSVDPIQPHESQFKWLAVMMSRLSGLSERFDCAVAVAGNIAAAAAPAVIPRNSRRECMEMV